MKNKIWITSIIVFVLGLIIGTYFLGGSGKSDNTTTPFIQWKVANPTLCMPNGAMWIYDLNSITKCEMNGKVGSSYWCRCYLKY